MKKTASSRRQLLFDTAASLFARQGYHGTSIRDIAQVLGIQKSSLYHYVASKEELLFLLLDDYVTVALEEIEKLCAEERAPAEKLSRFMRFYTGFYAGDQERLILLINELDCLSGDYRDILIGKERRYVKALTGIFSQLQEQGVMKPIPQSVAAFAFFGMVHYTCKWFHHDGEISAEKLGELFLEIFTRGVFT
ncbi:MAG TPA: TetR/AcrR family transcriptional regulator [Desulfobacteraceae bacterium]|nr:TetR family transcriptional regulator [Candidatus Anaeroferrophillus wilburensis]MBN2888752.1 TetR family transcriptional regulator [Deltaproteobacteria bacterium]HER62577.1 TetR/AcrR family transcriptional regulator [Desulfobacteraceae bacterium]